MKPLITGLLATLTLTSTLSSMAQAGEFISGVRTTDMLELYTSEGCSSCPPADRWFTSLKSDSGVFEQFIPLAFHVDYWNYLGWDDRFASSEYSNRQRKHVAAGNVRQSYTPQVVLNSKEWRGHLRGAHGWSSENKRAGVLKAVLNDENKLFVNFSPASGDYFAKDQLVLNMAYLGMGLKTEVERGENEGRELHHDFVVLQHTRQTVDAKPQKWHIDAPAVPEAGQEQTALVVWLSDPVTQKFVQAVGGYL